ncbi:MAG: hypothetical protein HY900_00520 [Deltaproteobacteria bacterium]|nr:hypothetical protein [Deltaproteobacteria bacterium]
MKERRKSRGFLLGAVVVSCCLAVAAHGAESRKAKSAGRPSVRTSQACISCHADNKISPVTGAKIVQEWRRGAHAKKSAAACPDCHKPNNHPNGGSIVGNPEDAVCTECHATTDPKLRSHFVSYPVGYTKGAPARKTVPPSGDVATYQSAVYVAAEDPSPCRLCHNPHDNSSVIQVNRDWAASGHADREALPFTKYRFKTQGEGVCSRCHTSTGFIYYVTTGSTIPVKGIKNNAINEVLGCKTCHVSYSWKRRSLKAVSAAYVATTAGSKPDVVAYPDAGESNLCLNCHVGRQSGDTIKGLPATVDFANTGFENSHYLTAGGTLFAQTGYEFSGRDYTKAGTITHTGIGITAPGTRMGKGPCVECHMSNANNHHFQPVARDGTGRIVRVLSTVCRSCHTGPLAATTEFLNQRKEGFEAALAVQKAQLAKKGFFFLEALPYFFKSGDSADPKTNAVRNWVSAGDGSEKGRATGEKNMGAAFNYNLLKHDPGAFAHNWRYTRELIYDSIDWLDDNSLNDSVGAALDALAAGGAVSADVKAKAQAYLVPRP